MTKQTSLQLTGLFFITIIILLASCKGNNSSPGTSDSSGIPAATNNATLPQGQAFLPIYLDTLWVEASAFALLHQKLAFRFYFDTSGAILMNGWNTNGNGPYSLNPDLKLEKGRASQTVQYHAGDYLGNLLLSSDDVNAIQKKARDSNALYILFAPDNPATAKYPGQVTYDVLIASDDPRPLVKLTRANVIATGVTTNPSPPGTAN